MDSGGQPPPESFIIFTRALPIHLSHHQIAAHQNGLLTIQWMESLSVAQQVE